jgi:hypothetical protein
MEIQSQEARIILAIEAIRIYTVPESTLRDKMTGRTPLNERRPAVHKLTKLEEEMIVRQILEMDSRGFSPRVAGVEGMANFILESRGKRVGKL